MATKILFIAPFYNGFIRKDLEILESAYRCKSQVLNWQDKSAIPFYFIVQTVFMIRHIASAKAVIIQFGGMWGVVPSFVARLFRKPVYVVLHGTDTASLPHYNYGSLRKVQVRKSCRYVYRNASLLLPVSESLIEVENTYNEEDQKQGVRVHFPDLNFEYEVIPNGLKAEQWSHNNPPERDPNRFIAVFSDSQYQLKGADLILAAAKALPNCQFRIAGTDGAGLKGKPKNLIFLGRLNQQQLKNEYYQASYHLQLSRFEGFGLALCEAMLCGCIPIGSSVNAIPEIIGNTGYVLAQHNELQFIELLKEVLSQKNAKSGDSARQRIVDNYPLSRRAEALMDLLTD